MGSSTVNRMTRINARHLSGDRFIIQDRVFVKKKDKSDKQKRKTYIPNRTALVGKNYKINNIKKCDK